ncbi:hypothetical protein R4Y45_01475 [Holzapfeliella sp. He02]|uniref:Uncharacterized protein n=1 Tax=Holzapfeliella saturejae TaxID=3082953 RepID=A0ABU8SF07_9LACO
MTFFKKNSKYMLLVVPFIIVLIINVFIKENNKQVTVYTILQNVANLFGIVSAVLSIIVINSVDKIKRDLNEDKNNQIIETEQKIILRQNFDQKINLLEDFITSLSTVHMSNENDDISEEINFLFDNKTRIYNLVSANKELLINIAKDTKNYKNQNFSQITNDITDLDFKLPNKEIYLRLERDLRNVETLLMLINKKEENY